MISKDFIFGKLFFGFQTIHELDLFEKNDQNLKKNLFLKEYSV